MPLRRGWLLVLGAGPMITTPVPQYILCQLGMCDHCALDAFSCWHTPEPPEITKARATEDECPGCKHAPHPDDECLAADWFIDSPCLCPVPCETCAGWGSVEIDDRDVPCRACKGTGER